MDGFAPLRHPMVFELPERLTDVVSWHEHVPFAFFAVAALRPGTIVELGTWKGDSYCAFCQAVASLELSASCHAVDTWEGDAHTGPYGPEVLDELRIYHDPLYRSFSELRQETFDEAAGAFADGSVDLLHIDGSHRYADVAHDFETWRPKLSERGVVLLHDTHVRQPEFGVWQLWAELSPDYPSFAFDHGHGLGVLAVGASVDAGFVEFLEAANRDPATGSFFAALGNRVAEPARQRLLLSVAEQRLAGREAELAAAIADRERAELAADELGHERDDARAAAEKHRPRARPCRCGKPRSSGTNATGRRRRFGPASTISSTSSARRRGG